MTCPAGFYCSSANVPPVPCPLGQHSAAGSSSCISCTAGFYSPDPTGGEIACATGYYSLGGAYACLPCPGGQICQANSLGATCGAGYYILPLTYAASCNGCTAGYYCSDLDHAPIACPAGTYSNNLATSCTICEAGNYCPSNIASAKVACTSGQYSFTGATTFTSCPDGFSCDGSGTVTACSAGSYSNAGGTACTSCEAGYYCPNGKSATRAACPSGSMSGPGASICIFFSGGVTSPNGQVANQVTCSSGQYVNGAFTCQNCPAGQYCPDFYVSPINCPSGTYSYATQTTCTVCEAGYMCPSVDGTGRVACTAGYFALPGSVACTICPIGFYCPSTLRPLMKECDAGYYAPTTGMAACSQCPANNYCKDKKTATPCPTGFYSLLGWGVCIQCPPGKSCSGATPTTCSAGTYSPEGTSNCLTCPSGYYCPAEASRPIPCQQGTAQGSTGQGSCTACSSGSYSLLGATACTLCPAGSYCAVSSQVPLLCPIGTYSSSGASSCTQCNSGYACPTGSTTATNGPCPLGFFCTWNTINSVQLLNFQPCPAGYYGTTQGQNTQGAACSQCPQGYYCPIVGMSVPLLCPKGKYCPTQSTSATGCTAGSYNPKYGSSSNSDCLACPAGSYCPTAEDEPIPCPPGYYCPASSSSYTSQCAAGTYASVNPSTQLTDCLTCPAGAYCLLGSGAPSLCPPGTYNSNTGSLDSTSCLSCGAGHACPKYGNIKDSGVPCPPGYYCTAGTQYPTQNPCAAGTYSDSFDAQSSATCLACPAGYICNAGTNRFTAPMVICPSGSWCGASTSTATITPCTAGTYNPYTGGTSSSSCSFNCPPGKYCPAGSSAPAGLCTDGYYCPQGTGAANANACPAGTYSTGPGLKSQTECVKCPAGYYCAAATTIATLTKCAAGTYQPSLGKSLTTDCTTCSAGYKCPTAGSTSMTPCGYGYYSDVGATTCITCPVTYYCNTPTTTLASITSLSVACAAGYICSGGVGEYPKASLMCPTGNYCLAQAVDPTPCPPGTYNPNPGSSSITNCVATPAGQYSIRRSSAPTGYCAPGFYCPINSVRANMVPCPVATFRALSGASQLSDCAPCPAGYFCPIGTATPRSCPIGFYCGAGVITPTKCAKGNFGASPLLRFSTQCIQCWAGRFCTISGLSFPDGSCDPGYYCISGSFVPNPTDGTTGNVCPAGGICPAGSKFPQPCPPGYYGTLTGLQSSAQCTQCTAGSYCIGEVKSTVSGSCAAGYYCPTQSSSAQQNAAQPGYYTSAGASTQTQCAAGSYTPNYATVTCTQCPAGYLCPAAGNTGVFTDCPAGQYCPLGSSTGTNCLAGTYSPITNLKASTDCLACPPGSYCSGGGSTVSGSCGTGYYCVGGAQTATPAGYSCLAGNYCPSGVGIPTPCGSGTYNPNTGSSTSGSCVNCDAGKFCSDMGLSAVQGLCNQGYYCAGSTTSPRPSTATCPVGKMCPAGSSSATPCTAGTYQPSVEQGSCIPCPKGYYCPQGSTGFDTGQDCPAGYYCPQGTASANANPCPAGSYNPSTNAFSSSQCILCDPGHYCPNTAMTALPADPANLCAAGYYCILGATTNQPPTGSTGGQCPAGTYCPQGTSYPRPCTAGYACPTAGLSAVGPACTAGYFCTLSATSVTPSGVAQGGGPCTPGYYCPSGSVAMVPCPKGTYSNANLNTALSQCTACDDGSYCAQPGSTTTTGQCYQGYYCQKATGATVGYTIPNPSSQICNKGYYCPTGTTTQVACSSSTYQDNSGQATCKPCPAGYYCSATAKTLCNPSITTISFYCPGGTRNYIQCSDGQYNMQIASYQPSDCLSCPQGYFCPQNPTGSQGKVNACPAGNYCPTGTGSSQGTPCQAGYYCPAGTALRYPCPPGFYCDIAGLTDTTITTRLCAAGYYCMGQATVSNPNDGTTGVICPAGFYCPSGIYEPVACPPGTYRALTGGQSLTDCTQCTATEYCPSAGQTSASIPCPAGYYCPTGTAAGDINPCTAGNMCPSGSSAQTPCPNNYYQALPVQSACVICPARYYCQNIAGVGATAPTICPMGQYCLGTSQPQNCPVGTFNPRTGMGSLAECEACTPGYMCTTTGLTAAVTQCTAGYYCISGVSVTNPNDATGHPCPAGHYCPTGTISPIPCPPGTYNDLTQQTASTACVNCPARYYCPYRAGTSAMYGLSINTNFYCSAGYLCISGSATPTPTDGVKGSACSVGTYCVAGALSMQNCPAFQYNPYVGQGTCFPCPPGEYCATAGLSTYVACPAGYYCPGGVDKQPCPAGTYNPGTINLALPGQCYPCDPGKYCLGGGSAPDGSCSAGYVCPRNAAHSTSALQYSWASPSTEGQCPPGYYCAAASKAPTPCAVGSYQDLYGQSSCKPCPAGRYCDVTGISDTTTRSCTAGYFCSGGATTPFPLIPAEGGSQCSEGNYCPTGTTSMINCPAGQYEPRPGQAVCQSCPAGFYCSGGASAWAPTACPANNYCPINSASPTVCPAGTYSNVASLQSSTQCRPCKSGSYCTSGLVQGLCAAGYYCDAGAASATDSTKLCPTGHYCLAGCTVPTVCPQGTVRNTVGGAAISDCVNCAAGYYCITSVPVPYTCPKGYYCPAGSSAPTACAIGYFLNTTGNTQLSNCIPCDPGYSCMQSGLAEERDYPCPVGNYCPNPSQSPILCPNGTYANTTGFSMVSQCIPCPEGYYCLTGTVTPKICDEGYYCAVGSSQEVICPAGYYCRMTNFGGSIYPKLQTCLGAYYCPLGTINPIKCDNGFYCPNGTAMEIPCPQGSTGSVNFWNINIGASCIQCSPGSYSVIVNGLTTSCLPCPAGYVCVYNTSSATPVDPNKDGGYQCPKGYYCPVASYVPTPCPAGYFNNAILGQNQSVCYPCVAGFYNDLEGQGGCKPCGPTSTSAAGATNCVCQGNNRVFQKLDGKCVCKQYYTSVLDIDSDDSPYDCRPQNMPSCSSGYLRDSFGNCVSPNNCTVECKGGSGTRTPGVGLCVCDSIQDPDAVCNSTCRANAPKMYISLSGQIVFANQTAINMSSLSNVAGEPICTSGTCKMVSIAMNPTGGFSANYQPSPNLVSTSTKSRLLSEDFAKRLLGTTTSSISNPSICINSGDTMTFDITQTSYPVYIKDAMANSNPSFDASPFNTLATRISNGETINVFIYTFSQAGVYVFGDCSNLAQQTIITVVSSQQTCPNTDKYITPITASSLLTMGVVQNENITLVPNWIFVGCCFIVILILIPAVIVCIAFFHNQSGEGKALASISFKKNEVPPENKDANKVAPGLPQSKEHTEEAPMLSQRHIINIKKEEQADRELDPSIFEEIYKQLTEHAAYVRKEFEKKSGQDGENIDNVKKQMRELKKLMKNKLKGIAKIFGKNIKYMLSKKVKKELVDIPSDKKEPVSDESSSDEEMENAENEEDDKEMMKEVITNCMASDAQELEKYKEEGKEKIKEFMEKFVDMQNHRLDDFKERVLENSKLSEGDKQAIMKEYEKQLQNLQKQLLLDQAGEENQLKLRIEERKTKREQLLQQKERLSKQKEEVKRQTGKLIEEIDKKVESGEKQIDADIDAEIKAEEEKVTNEKNNNMNQIRKKFDKKLKKTADSQKRSQVLEEFESASKDLEKMFEEQKGAQLKEFKEALEKRRKERKADLVGKTEEERQSIVELCKRQIENIREEENLIHNKLANVAIKEKVNEAKEDEITKRPRKRTKIRKNKAGSFGRIKEN